MGALSQSACRIYVTGTGTGHKPGRRRQSLRYNPPSDRGVQYACDAYIDTLVTHHIRVSMTEDYNPTDNAVAERMNGILKTEWIYGMSLFKDKEMAREQIAEMIDFYNNERPHMSIGMKKPMDVYYGEVPGKSLWKK